MGYLSDAAARGFTHAHLWVAPPAAGQDYIFPNKTDDPAHRNRPMPPAKLRAWYMRMLERAQVRSVAIGLGLAWLESRWLELA